MQRVDVLGDDRDVTAVFGFQAGQRLMGGVGDDPGSAEQAARLVVEVEHLLLVAVPAVQGGDILEVDPVPQPVGIAEGIDAAFLGDACPGQYHDAGRAVFLMHVKKSSAMLG